MSIATQSIVQPNAPIAIFCYKRPMHLKNTLQTLKQCEGFAESPIYVFGDGPVGSIDINSVHQTRYVARETLGSNAQYHFREKNMGLANSIVHGVNYLLEIYDRVIVVEDDLLLHKYFIRFMNEALQKYSMDETAYQVSGYIFPTQKLLHYKNAVILPLTTSWGWATWRRAWIQFDPDASGWDKLANDSNLRNDFNLGGVFDYASMLERQMMGKSDSWAIRWYWTVFKNKGLIIYPPVSLVNNSGFDGSGTHGRGIFSNYTTPMRAHSLYYPIFPEKLSIDPYLLSLVSDSIRMQSGGKFGKIVRELRQIIGF
jgi:hypothetical protein